MTTKRSPVTLEVDSKPVSYIGPATRDNPLSQIRKKLLGNVYFNDPKAKWNRITLRFTGKAGLNMDAPSSSLPRDVAYTSELQEADNAMTHLETTITVCEVEKELIYNREKMIDFGLHLPPFLPPSIKTKHAFVNYTLSVICSAGPFSKKQKVEIPVKVCRHYLPSPSSLIPSVEYKGIREWFEWSAEVPKATAIEVGEVAIALCWSVEKERVQVDRVELSLEELETYRFSTKTGVHSLSPIVTQFPATAYHPPSFSNSSETHFIRTPIYVTKSLKVPRPIRTHHFDPFLEISHRLSLVIYFSASADPLKLYFPIIITDFPADITADYFLNALSPTQSNTSTAESVSLQPGGDEVTCVDLDLPEYTPRYESISSDSNLS
ncbi:hypothetical protein K501DRAFT_259146 [Backusella circina FSU 941]|nr:hypothetical protein K501DRAFT_259146 [Backusella circina FSU 941]